MPVHNVLLRFSDLQSRGIVRSRRQLANMVGQFGFPAGYKLTPNTRVWDLEAVEGWLERRRQAAAPGKELVR